MLRPVFYDLQGAQSLDHRDRGIARYVAELALALEAADPGRVHTYLVNPDLALPSGIEPLVASRKVRHVDGVEVPAGAVLHLPSTIELAIPLRRLLPPQTMRTPISLVATVFDLVPEAMPDEYLADAGRRRRYRSRLGVLRHADAVIAISQHSAREATRLLGIPPRRLRVVPLVPSATFRPPRDVDAAFVAASGALQGLRRDFVLYTGGSDGRKNVERLLEAWARLPERVRTRWQLVLACHLPPLRANHFRVLGERLGLGDGFLVAGFVDEATLVHLNQAAALAVMPSLDEGFGFPIVEALACGTPAIGSDRTSIPELLPPEALFDPTDTAAIAAAIERALTDARHREALTAWARRPVRTWTDVAAATAEVYDRVSPPSGTRGRGRRDVGPRRIAFTTPLPPQPGGVADYSHRLLEELVRIAETPIDVYVDGPPHARDAVVGAEAPAGVRARPIATLERIEAVQGTYDTVVYSLGNSEYHTGSLASLQRRPGIVLAHDVRLTNLYRFAAWQHPDATPGGFHATLQRMYPGQLPATLGEGGSVGAAEAEQWGILMARGVIAASERFLVTSAFAAELARLDAKAHDRHKVEVLPFSVGAVPVTAPTPVLERPSPPIVGSFGVVNALKQGTLVVEAFAEASRRAGYADAELVFVGPAGPAETASVSARARELGVGERVTITGEVDGDGYRAWLDRAWVAVQLRSATNGESSGAIGDCLTAGIPTIATAIGPNRDLPASALVTVPVGAGADTVAVAVERLLRDPDQRRRLSEGARAYAAEHSFAAAAAALYRAVSSDD